MKPGFTTPPPIAKRLNRNALTVAAVIMGMTVIASLVVLRSDSSSATPGAVPDPVLEGTTPAFLDRPAAVRPGASPRPDSVRVTESPPPSLDAMASPPAPPARFGRGDSARSMPLYPDYSQSDTRPSSQGVATVEPRRQAFAAALLRSAMAKADGGVASQSADMPAGPASSSASLASEEARLLAFGDSVTRSTMERLAPSPAAIPSGAATANPRLTFMQQAGDLGGGSAVARLERAGSPFVLRAGTLIPAVLLTAITSDLPGECLGQVSRDVFDSRSQRLILIPKGSKLMCRYDDQVVAGQGRLLVAWTRLLLPDGRAMSLPGLALKDAQGQTGAKGDVDNHTRRVFGRALLLSLIGAGVQLSQPRQASILAAPTTGQVMAGAVGQELSNVALEIIRRGMDQAPTITVPQGRPFNVFLNGDLVFDGPYTPTP